MKTSTSASILLSLTAATLLVSMPMQVGIGARDPRKLDAELAALGLADSVHFDEIDSTPGADRRWSFPMARAAQLKPGDPLVFALPGGAAISLPLVERTMLDARSVVFVFADPARGASAEITVRSGLVRGTVRALRDGAFEQWSLASGIDAHGIAGDYYSELPNAQAGTHESLTMPASEQGGGGDAGGEGGIAGGTACTDTGEAIDVLLAYTPAMRSIFGNDTTALEAALTGDLGWASSAMANSLALPRFRVAGFLELSDNGTGSLTDDLVRALDTADNWNDELQAARDTARADIVAIYSDSAVVGSAAILGVTLDGDAAYCTIGRTSAAAPTVSLARALGATLGCCWQADFPTACPGFYPYSHAWIYAAAGVQYQTVMANADGAVIPVYSNPLVEWLGGATGTATANNARTASLTATTVANYRCSNADVIDCDGDGVADGSAIQNGLVPDCNVTGIPDSCDIAIGLSLDLNADGVPDECPVTEIELTASDVTPLDTLGSAVGMSAKSGDPEILCIAGAPGNDAGASNAGAAYVFSWLAGVPVPGPILQSNIRVANAFFGRGATVYRRPVSTGTTVFPARDFALVGAYRETEIAAVGTFPSKGALYLFARESNIWTQLWRYTPPATNTFQARENALFGYAVAMGRNPREGADQIIVGAPGHTNGQGKVYLLRNYIPNAILGERGGLLSTRAAASPVDGDNYGAAVALEPAFPVNTTSRVIGVIGAPGRNNGKGLAWVFDRSPSVNGGIGVFPNSGLSLNPPTSAALSEGDRYGTAVAISQNLIAIGAPGASEGKGVVHFWERSSTVVNPIASTYQYRGFFKAPEGATGDALGSSISIAPAATGTGFTVIVSAPKADLLLDSGLRINAGKVYVLHKTIGQSGAELLQVRTSYSPASGDEFGYSSAAIRGLSIIGAPFSDLNGLNSGKARILTTP